MYKSKLPILDKPYVDTNDELSLFVSTFKEQEDAEIAALLLAWMKNGTRGELGTMRRFMQETVGERPKVFLDLYANDEIERFDKWGDASFCGMLTYTHLHNILGKLHVLIHKKGTIEKAYNEYVSGHRRTSGKYAHDVISALFSGNTGFPTPKSTCTFYRINLFLYWMVYKLRVWKTESFGNFILPCSDIVFERAHKEGLTKIRLKTNLSNAVHLTHISRSLLGDMDFFKMYELLNQESNG